MNRDAAITQAFEQRFIKPLYLFLLFTLGLTGFSQMPIFKRYYIADIPGLGWLAEFYVTHVIHYLGAIALLFLMVYCGAVYVALLRRKFRLTTWAYVRIALLAGITATGVLRVLKNLPEIFFSPGFTMFIDLSHLASMMLFIVAAVVAAILHRRWLKEA
ncbi:MAG: FeS-binding protein [Desulfobacteraceae bacterium]|nr:MAG: FeS-binding protein [Desulfobacteraceae bacterium]